MRDGIALWLDVLGRVSTSWSCRLFQASLCIGINFTLYSISKKTQGWTLIGYELGTLSWLYLWFGLWIISSTDCGFPYPGWLTIGHSLELNLIVPVVMFLVINYQNERTTRWWLDTSIVKLWWIPRVPCVFYSFKNFRKLWEYQVQVYTMNLRE